MKKKSWLIGIGLVALVTILGMLTYTIFFKNNKKVEEEKKDTSTTSEIAGYGITLDEDDTELYKTEFDALKGNLESGNIDYTEYAKSVAKLFIIDLYTIDNKTNKYDVGGLEFVHEGAKENFITNVTDTIYKYVEDNSKKTRKQDLPIVSGITVESIEESTFTIKSTNQTHNSYKVKLTWNYTNDLGYDTKCEVVVINDNSKLYVVEENISK